MSTLHRVLVRSLCCAALLSFGCDDGSGDDDTDQSEDAAMHPDGHDDDVEYDEVPCTATHPKLTPGLSASGDGLTLKVVSSDPPRARARVRNDWVVEIADESGAPLNGVEFQEAGSYMQAHGHAGLPAPKLEMVPEPGRIKLDNINFNMVGPWEVTVVVARAGERSKRIVVNVCVE